MTMSDLIAVMYDGSVQQFGPPEEIYNRPNNVFVAGFIGSPPMNFLEARIGEEPLPTLQLADAVLSVPAEFSQGVRDLGSGKAVVLGIRPQEVSLENPDRGDSLTGRVAMIELLGSEKLVEIRLARNQKIIAQVRADHPVAIDDNVQLALGPSNLHLFDQQTGASLRA
jgi:ABC-type sugar transport system ATPase subunit